MGRNGNLRLPMDLVTDFAERFYERIGEMADDFRELAAELPDEIPQGGGCLVTCGDEST